MESYIILYGGREEVVVSNLLPFVCVTPTSLVQIFVRKGNFVL